MGRHVRSRQILAVICLSVVFVQILIWRGAIPADASSPSAQTNSSQMPAYLLAIARKSGVFSFAAHDHAVLASESSLHFMFHSDDLTHSSVNISVPVSSLTIDSAPARQLAGLGSGPSQSDIVKIQRTMLSADVLDATRYPQIQFASSSVKNTGPGMLEVAGQFSMHGQTRQVAVPVHYEVNKNGEFTFSGEFTIKQTDFGIRPQTVAGGTVKVKDDVEIRFRVHFTPATEPAK